MQLMISIKLIRAWRSRRVDLDLVRISSKVGLDLIRNPGKVGLDLLKFSSKVGLDLNNIMYLCH